MKRSSRMAFSSIGISLLSLILTSFSAQAITINAQNITSAFKSIQNKNAALLNVEVPKWPVAGSSTSDIESNFGPRIQTSTGKYDWHRGIDIDAKRGTNVFAAQSGELWKVVLDGDPLYKDGGNVIIVRHKFPNTITYNGKTLTYYYTLYMHLDTINPALIKAANQKPPLSITTQTLIGTVGHTGEANIADHLHFELRVGTYCTLQFQLANPTSSCSKGFGFDPAMNPLLLFAPTANPASITISTSPTIIADGKVHITMSDAQPLLNRVEFTITSSNNSVIKSSVLDFDERTGFNAQGTVTLDTQNKTLPYIAPLAFTDTSLNYQTDVVIPKSYTANYLGAGYQRTLTIEDIWGNRQSVKW